MNCMNIRMYGATTNIINVVNSCYMKFENV